MTLNNKRAKIIGLTGGIATGKSTASQILKGKGFPVIDADLIARKVVEIGKPVYNDIVCTFGEEILNEDLTINRVKLGDIIFKNLELRRKLNSIVHPRVTSEIVMQVDKYVRNSKVIFLDIPLLIEEKENLKDLTFDEIWLIYSSEEVQIRRLMERDNIDFDRASARVNSQMPIDEKRKYVDVIIDNSKDIATLEETLDRIIARII